MTAPAESASEPQPRPGPAGASTALEIRDLVVTYGKRRAVDGLSLTVAPGEIVGMLGPNGAGKSTTLAAVAGQVGPAAGTISIMGHDLAKEPMQARSRVGFADQPPSLYEFFTVEEHLTFVAEARGQADPAGQRALLEELGIGSIADRMCRELSFGMRQRVGLAAAMVGGVDLILLDETLNGLDPRAAVSARQVLSRASAEGKAVVLSTHLLGVAERLCHRIVIIDRGVLKVDMGGDQLRQLVDRGAGAIEALYLEQVEDAPP